MMPAENNQQHGEKSELFTPVVPDLLESGVHPRTAAGPLRSAGP